MKKNIQFNKYYKNFNILSLSLVLLSLILLLLKGLNYGIDFKGGTELVLDLGNHVSDESLKNEMDPVKKIT